MTKSLTPTSKSFALTAVAKSIEEQEAITYFKEVCRRDGLEMRTELIKLINIDWVKRHPKPGNPQLMLFQKKKKVKATICELCKSPAVFRCSTIFSINPVKLLCRDHTVQGERRNEILKKEVIK